MSGELPSTSVVVPTYRRPSQLARCLAGLARQSLPPDEVVVVHREDDSQTRSLLARSTFPGKLVSVTVDEPGVLAAMKAGVRSSGGQILAFTDDDAVPSSDWLERLMEHFGDDDVGAVGGRDVLDSHRDHLLTHDVGRIGRWGKLIGNHHLGTGPPRAVSVLKGCNMAFRRSALALPRGLRGSGAEAHFEVATCGWAEQSGLRVIYDPQITVDHFPGARYDADRRGRPEKVAIHDASYNLVASLLAARPDLFWRRAIFGLLVGDRGTPGIVRALVALRPGQDAVVRDLHPSLTGQTKALWDFARGRRVEVASFTAARRPTVALVAHDIHDNGGMERACAELIRRGHRAIDFVVIAASLADDLQPLVRWRRVRVPSRPFPLKFTFFFLGAGARLHTTRRDVVHTMGAIVPNRADVASIHFCHAGFREATGRLSPVGSPFVRRINTGVSRGLALAAERWCYRNGRVRVLAAVSPGLERELARHYPGLPIAITPNGVDAVRLHPDEHQRDALRASLGIEPEAIVALFVGGDWDRKNLGLAIEGLAQARSFGASSLSLWIVGHGDEARFRALARHEGVDASVRFFGPRSDAERFYQAADVFVLPTLYETFSLVAYEAAASGLPIVATPASGIEDLIGDGRAGILVDRSAASVGAALARLAEDPGERRQMGRIARSRAEAYTWDKSVESVLSTLRGLVAEQAA